MDNATNEIIQILESRNIGYERNGSAIHVPGDCNLFRTQITELPDGLSVGGGLYLDPTRQLQNCTAYRKNCGPHYRTIFAVWMQGEFKISAGCFFGGFDCFCAQVRKKYPSDAADAYIGKAQECVDELTTKLEKVA